MRLALHLTVGPDKQTIQPPHYVSDADSGQLIAGPFDTVAAAEEYINRHNPAPDAEPLDAETAAWLEADLGPVLEDEPEAASEDPNEATSESTGVMATLRKWVGLGALLAALLASCAPSRKLCERAYGPCGTVQIERSVTLRDTTIYVPGATVERQITQWDTLRLADTLRYVDTTGRAELVFWRGQANQLWARCHARADTVFVPRVERIETVREISPAPQPTARPGWNIGWALLIVVFFVWFAYFGYNAVLRILKPF